MIDDQNRIMDAGSRSGWSLQESMVAGHARAQQMVDLLKNQELQRVFAPLNSRGKQMLQENSEMRNPVAIIAGAASLWMGRTIHMMKWDNFKIDSHLEARARSGQFSLESPLLNGKLSFTGGDGMSMSVNRKITSIDSRADIVYNARDQSIGGQLTRALAPHLDLNFGASQSPQLNQTDGRATLLYNLNF